MQTFPHSWPNKKKIASIINQHLEQQVSARTWLIAFYTTKFKNSSIKWDPSTSIHMNSNQSMIKTVLRKYPQQQVLMQSTWKTLNRCSRKYFKITIQNQMTETTIQPHSLHKGTTQMAHPSLTAGLMASHQIFVTTANIENIRRKNTNSPQLYQIRWEDVVNVASSTAN